MAIHSINTNTIISYSVYKKYKQKEIHIVKIPMNIKYSRKDPVMRKEYNRVWRNKYNHTTASIKRKLSDYRYMDKKAGREICDYTYADLLFALSTNRCTYCNSINNLGLDRIDNDRGHTKDNTVVCCKECNALKSNIYTKKDMLLVADLLHQKAAIEQRISNILKEHKQKE